MMYRMIAFCLLLIPGLAMTDQRLLGVWENEEIGIRLDILDGFKPNKGVVLSIENGVETSMGSWETIDGIPNMVLGWTSDKVLIVDSDAFEWNDRIYRRKADIEEEGISLLKTDESEFIAKLTSQIWLTYDGSQITTEFKSTFSPDSGVVGTFLHDGELKAQRAWGVSSGVLKIGSDVIIEARISARYMVGVTSSDRFFVFKSIGPLDSHVRIDMKKKREEFLSALLTDTWRTPSWGGWNYYKFRPIEGPLKGRRFWTEEDRFRGVDIWEYSPTTGALRIGGTEYIGGLVMGDALALLEKDGDQRFYQRKPGGPGRASSTSDVKTFLVSEAQRDLGDVLSGQFQFQGYLYNFEFNDDKRTGYVHRWLSDSFMVTGHTLKSETTPTVETIYTVEDFVVFGDSNSFALKRDATASRLRPKTESEVVQDQQAMEQMIRDIGRSRVVLRIMNTSGEKQDIVLPVASMAEIAHIEIVGK